VEGEVSEVPGPSGAGASVGGIEGAGGGPGGVAVVENQRGGVTDDGGFGLVDGKHLVAGRGYSPP